MVLESRSKDGEGEDITPASSIGSYPFYICDIWDDSAGGEGFVEPIVEEESVDYKEYLEA